jgi:glycosyltransferase involved in cell wall biosynthesis
MTVDIMMPFYGDPELFRLAVESVLGQSDPDWRLVVIDDRYPDRGPGEWLRSLPDARIRYIRNEENLGVSGNFGRSIELAEAEFVTIMGCDDLLLPRYVARMHELIRGNRDAAYIQPGVVVIDDDGRPSLPLPDRVKRHYAPRLPGVARLQGEPLATGLARGNWTYFPSICWRRQVLETHGFDPQLDVALDLDLQFRIVDAGGVVVVDHEETFAYRRHRGSVSAWKANDGSRFREERAVLDAAAGRARVRGWRRTERSARTRFSSRLSALSRLPDAVSAGDRAGVRSLLRHAFLR